MRRCLLAAILLTGCARMPIYMEPAGHSTSYRAQAEAHDRGLSWQGSVVPFEHVEEFGDPRDTPFYVREPLGTGESCDPAGQRSESLPAIESPAESPTDSAPVSSLD